jgi:hypothetical protein
VINVNARRSGQPRLPSAAAIKPHLQWRLVTRVLGQGLVFGSEPEERLSGEIDDGENDEEGLGSKIVKGALIAGAVLAIAAAASEPTQPTQPLAKRKRHRRGRRNNPSSGSIGQTAARPVLPHWLVELDRIRQNTIISEKTCQLKMGMNRPLKPTRLFCSGI